MEASKFAAVGHETIVPLTQTRSHALFAVTERALGPGRVEIGARLERVVHTPEEASALPRRSFSLGNGSVGYQWQLSRDSAITASFTHAERAPAIEELYSNGAHIATLTYDVGNAALTRERSQNLDLSYKPVSYTHLDVYKRQRVKRRRIRHLKQNRPTNRHDEVGQRPRGGDPDHVCLL